MTQIGVATPIYDTAKGVIEPILEGHKMISTPASKGKTNVLSSQIKMGFNPMITLLVFSTAMLIMPLATYFYIRRYLIDSTTFGAMGAIIMVQVILAAYIYKAWTDENREHVEDLKSKKKK